MIISGYSETKVEWVLVIAVVAWVAYLTYFGNGMTCLANGRRSGPVSENVNGDTVANERYLGIEVMRGFHIFVLATITDRFVRGFRDLQAMISEMDQISPLPALPQDEVRVGAWAEVRELLELQLAPLGRRGLAALAPHPGESVLDIGCGGGETALELVRAVAPDGTVVGIDLSSAALSFAQRAAQGCKRVRFVQADAEVFPFEPASFDAAFSRFGVMFFADPAAAFINIRRSLRPNGRLAFVCWRALEENPLDFLPLRAASAHLPPQPAHDPDAPGPFAFANPDRVRGILEGAGFGEIDITAHDEQVGSGDLDAMLAVCSRVGALGKVLRENPELRAATLPAVRSALAGHDGPDGVRLNAATWVVTARAPAGL